MYIVGINYVCPSGNFAPIQDFCLSDDDDLITQIVMTIWLQMWVG